MQLLGYESVLQTTFFIFLLGWGNEEALTLALSIAMTSMLDGKWGTENGSADTENRTERFHSSPCLFQIRASLVCCFRMKANSIGHGDDVCVRHGLVLWTNALLTFACITWWRLGRGELLGPHPPMHDEAHSHGWAGPEWLILRPYGYCTQDTCPTGPTLATVLLIGLLWRGSGRGTRWIALSGLEEGL